MCVHDSWANQTTSIRAYMDGPKMLARNCDSIKFQRRPWKVYYAHRRHYGHSQAKKYGINLLSNETESGLKQGSQLLFLIGDDFALVFMD
jgi:hypothetical protein